MPQLSKKTIIIIAIISVLIIIVIVADIFLFLKYRESQQEAQKQAKINADIAQVQDAIQSGQIAQLDVTDLKQQGLADEAIAIAEQAKIEEDQRQLAEEARREEEKPVDEKAIDIFRDYEIVSADRDKYLQQLNDLGDELIPSLQNNLDDSNLEKRYFSYTIINFIAHNEKEKRSELIPIIKKGLTDPAPAIRASSATWLSYYGEKDAIPVLIKLLDDQYSNILVQGEPPQYANIYALSQLQAYTQENFLYDQAKWLQWWEENKDNLQWDENTYKFK